MALGKRIGFVESGFGNHTRSKETSQKWLLIVAHIDPMPKHKVVIIGSHQVRDSTKA